MKTFRDAYLKVTGTNWENYSNRLNDDVENSIKEYLNPLFETIKEELKRNDKFTARNILEEIQKYEQAIKTTTIYRMK